MVDISGAKGARRTYTLNQNVHLNALPGHTHTESHYRPEIYSKAKGHAGV